MKKLNSIALLFAFVFLLVGCKKDSDPKIDNGDDILGTPITIKGEIDMASTQAAKVLAISTKNTYKQVNIAGNKFSVTLDKGKPWGLIFLNSADQPLGILSLGNGIETLPLHYANANIDSIDLKVISRSGDIFTPAYNPIGNEIPLTADQIKVIAGMDDYLTAILKNPDVNANGQIDLVEGKLYKLTVIYFVKPGRFNSTNLTPTLDSASVIEGFRLFLTVRDATYPDKVYFSGPAGSRLSNTTSEGDLTFDNHRVFSTPYISDISGANNLIPPGGNYTIKYGNQTLNFNLADQSYVANNIVYPWPTLTLNANGTMNKIDWSYRYSAGTVNFNLSAVMRNVSISLEGSGNKCGNHQNSDRLYDSDRLPVSTTSHTFSCQNIEWGSGQPGPTSNRIERIMLGYEDHYDATYVVMYERNY